MSSKTRHPRFRSSTPNIHLFGSDWPQSESLEFNSYPNVFGVARAYVRSKGPSALEKVFWRNSLKPYRWVQRLPSQRQA